MLFVHPIRGVFTLLFNVDEWQDRQVYAEIAGIEGHAVALKLDRSCPCAPMYMYKYIVRASTSFLLHESINRSYHTFHQVMSPESMQHASLPPSMEAGTPRVAYCGAWSLASEFSMSFLFYILLGTAFATFRKRVEQLLPIESRTYFFSAESNWIGIIS